MKISLNKFFKYFLFISFFLVHFDPLKSQFTIPVIFIPLFILTYYRLAFKNYLPILLCMLSILYPLFNLLIFKGFDYSLNEFFFTYILYIVAAFIYVAVIYLPLKNLKFDLGKILVASLYVVLFISSLQFFGFLLLKTTIFFNPFGSFQFNNMANVEILTANYLPRAQGFYLEPSYLGLVTITLICIGLVINEKPKQILVLGILIIIVSGSRGAFFGIFLILLWYFYFNLNNSSSSLSLKILNFTLLGGALVFFIFFSSIFALFTIENLSQENTSQYARFYSGFKLSGYILESFWSGVPLGSIEKSFVFFLGENNTSYSFFFFNIFYHGWLSFFLLLFIVISIVLQKKSFKSKILLVIFLILYFNMSGSVIAPDTYFWFVCFYYVYRVYSDITKPIQDVEIKY